MIQLYRYSSTSGMKYTGVTASSIEEMLANPEKFTAQLGDSKANIFYTVHHSVGGDSRTFVRGEYIFFDIDNVDKTQVDKYAEITAATLGCLPSDLTVIDSGNGLHIMAHLKEQYHITNDLHFERLRLPYKHLIAYLEDSYKGAGLTGKLDAIFDRGRVLRMPGTMNIKPGREHVPCTIIQVSNATIDFDLSSFGLNKKTAAQLPDTAAKSRDLDALPNLPALVPSVNTPMYSDWVGHIEDSEVYKEWTGAPPNSVAVMEGCSFLKKCKEEPQNILEPAWYAMLSITARLQDGWNLSHQLSQGHPSYTHRETARKINQALENSGPRTCKSIDAIWGGCSACPNYCKVKSPIQLRPASDIKTENTGFYNVEIDPKGKVTRTPNYDDLVLALERDTQYKIARETEDYYFYDGEKFILQDEIVIRSYAQKMFKPSPNTTMVREFTRRAMDQSNKHFRTDDLNKYPMLLNCKNGVVNLINGELKPHSPEYLFTHSLEVDYDPVADCPKFKEWILGILGSEEMVEAVLDYFSYSLCGVHYSNDTFMVLTGGGANGKSTLLRIMAKLFGEYVRFSKPTLFNNFGKEAVLSSRLIAFEELPSDSEKEFWEEIKDLSSGGVAVIDRKFKAEVRVQCKAKFIFICNRMPMGSDSNYGFYRRFFIVPFNKRFGKDELLPNYEENFFDELPGILNLLQKRVKRLSDNRFKIKQPKESINALNAYKESKDIYTHYFVNYFAKIDPSVVVNVPYKCDLDKIGIYFKMGDLYDNHFLTYCQDQGIRNVPNKKYFILGMQACLDDMGLKDSIFGGDNGDKVRSKSIRHFYPLPVGSQEY